jgi:peptidoglycan hydrolase CwlO-like protein
MADSNGTKTVSLALYIATLVIAIIINAVAVTAAILSRPTEDKVKIMIGEQFQEQSYLGQKLKNIEKEVSDIKDRLNEHQIKTEK